MEYANNVWAPYYQEDIKRIEGVQKRATKLIRNVRDLSYENRLRVLHLPTLKFRRIRGDVIQVFKILKGFYDSSAMVKFDVNTAPVVHTRGNKLKIFQHHVHYNLRKYFFSNRVVTTWNSLPDTVIEAETVNSFKNRLDKFWKNQDVMFNWKTDLAGTGDRSLKLNS